LELQSSKVEVPNFKVRTSKSIFGASKFKS
jgi:hypothetical protein